MSHQYTMSSSCCGACKYWCGERKVIGNHHIEVKDTQASGTCTKSGNIRCGKQMEARESCSQWTKV